MELMKRRPSPQVHKVKRTVAGTTAPPQPMTETTTEPGAATDVPEPAQRFLFRVAPIWLALIADQHAPDRLVTKMFAGAIEHAAAVGHGRGGCLVCHGAWSTGRPPAGALMVTPLAGEGSGFAGLIGSCCWAGMDERLREVIERAFGYAPGDLQPLHAEGTA
jgi:hypothetical protein